LAERVDAVVVGAGVVGLACARALARAGRDVLILEAADAFGTETSSRSSEVMHAGLYYPTGSLKARLCVQGLGALYAYCESHGVAHRRCGKLIVATSPEQEPALLALQDKARENGAGDLPLLTAAQARGLEPDLSCVAALHSPNTGIIDSHGLMLSYLGEAEEAGAMLALSAPVERGRLEADGVVLEVGGAAPMTLAARLVVNAAGLQAVALARRIDGLEPATVPPAFFAKGNYFALAGRAPFSRLVYPMPEPGGLGGHLTIDLGGQARFGPDVEWVPAPTDYAVDPARCARFYGEIRRYWPALPDGALQPAYAGIRPKLVGPGAPAADFLIQGPAEHGAAGLINLFGIESPGLTASLALADEVARLAG